MIYKVVEGLHGVSWFVVVVVVFCLFGGWRSTFLGLRMMVTQRLLVGCVRRT